MYESEANQVISSKSELPAEIAARFAESRKTVSKRTLIPWGEHCTECVWPTCYSTCDLYSPRADGRCRRFVEGMVRIPCPESLNRYLLKISFKRWGKMWSTASARLYSLADADRAEEQDIAIASGIRIIPVNALRNALAHKRYSWKKRWARRAANVRSLPNCMLIECYNPGATPVQLTLTIRAEDSQIPFQELLTMGPGFNRYRVGTSEIQKRIDICSRLDVEITPNEISDGCTLFFGALDFVVDAAYVPEKKPTFPTVKVAGDKPKLCKCVVWDLDNTLWDGILTEDGLDGIRLKPGIPEILKTLDERGILISAVSKNNFEDATAALKRFGISEYFLFPQIGWLPKSQGVQEIATQLNIGADSLLFVDDSRFEREQVASVCPEVMLLDANEYQVIVDRPDCQSPVTDESRKRRFFYREQQVRDGARNDFQGGYFDFLRNCQLRLSVRTLTETNLERVHELTQRTNQMNFSGNRYTREQLRQLAVDPDIDTYVLDCEDRFGAYGTIGFSTINNRENRMTDLMFSCRVQAKRVEHAFVSHLLRKYREHDEREFYVNYRKTKKNAVPGKVFDDLGFESVREIAGVTELRYPANKDIPDDDIVEITEKDEPVSVACGH